MPIEPQKFEPIVLDILQAQTVNELEETCFTGNNEANHALADEILCQLLIKLGYKDVIETYRQVGKWYA